MQTQQNSNSLIDRYGQPCKVNAFYLALSWSISRGRDTYGYNICRLDVPYNTQATARRYKCMGGGYDMTGTVIGEWLQDQYQTRLKAIAERAGSSYVKGQSGSYTSHKEGNRLYGMTAVKDKADKLIAVQLDGGCGIRSMEAIANAIGIHWSTTGNRKGHTTGFMVTDYGSAENAKAMGRE